MTDPPVTPPRAPNLGDLRAAVQFLTRFPTGPTADPGDLAPATAWFPTVGLLVAGVGIAVRAGLEPALGIVPATFTAVLATVAATGAFHEDGLADTADGLWGGSRPQQRLEIMRDSRLGTYGTCALVGDLGLRTVLLASLPFTGFVRAMLAAQVLGRLAPLVLAAWLPPARPDGQGVRAGRLGRAGWLLAGTSTLLVAVVTGGVLAPALLVATGVGVGAVGRLARTRLGGTTGDVLGAGVQVSGLLVTATLVAVSRASP